MGYLHRPFTRRIISRPNEILTPTRHKLSVEDYHKLGATGVLNADSRVELIDGELIDMAPIDSVHLSVVNALSMSFARQVADLAIVSTQNPVSLPTLPGIFVGLSELLEA
ncbi:MAG TPA: Uma2 family endonuclease [Casimicrobiaceae bacterium]|nr:Uma2 family endonuclease [Casimicrobiaceae bacterium]